MLSRTTAHALRTLGYLVERRGSRIPGEEIARATGVPANYLSKILNVLRKRGIVDSEKGWGGGFELREDALGLQVREIVIVLEGVDPLEQNDCVFGLPECGSEAPCPLHSHWERIRGTLNEMVTTLTVRDLGRDSTTKEEGDKP